MEPIYLLLVVFHCKHFACDYLLQNQYMLQKGRPGWDFLLPLASHAAVHAGFTLLICLAHGWEYSWLAVLDFVAHFTMDRIKDGPRFLGRFRDQSRSTFWYCLGFDQMVHHLTHLFIVWCLLNT